LSEGDREDDNRSDISDVSRSSVTSMPSSLFSVATGSSMSSIGGPEGAEDKLIYFLLGDNLFHSLCIDALNSISQARFERNLRRLLVTFATELKKEAKTPQEKRAAQFVRSRARNSAHIICNALKPIYPKPKSAVEEPLLVEDLPYRESLSSDDSTSDASEDDLNDFQELERFIACSSALEILKEKLRAFIHPEATRETAKDKPALRTRILSLKLIFSAVLSNIKISAIRTKFFTMREADPVEAGKIRVEWQCVILSQVLSSIGANERSRSVDKGSTMTSQSFSQELLNVLDSRWITQVNVLRLVGVLLLK
jgi:hypothetical protein